MKAYAVAVLLICAPIGAQAGLPAFKPIRSDEDYGFLKADPSDDWNSRLKYLRLDGAGDVYLSLGGELRVRADAIDAPRFGVGGEKADSFILERTLLSADLHLGSRVWVFGELGVHRDLGKADPPAPSDRDSADVQVLFADMVPDAARRWRVRLGRQELMLNSTQRFVSVREGPNIRQSFDGVSLRYGAKGFTLDAFYLRPVRIVPGAFNDPRNHGQLFYGAYGSIRIDSEAAVDLYVLRLERDSVRFGSVTADEGRTSMGARLAGKHGAVDYDLEGLIQRGTFGGQQIRAWGVGLSVGYTFDMPWSPRLGVRFDSGSGDRDPGDAVLGTFNPLFPKGAYFNETALTSFANLRAVRLGVGITPVKPVQLEASVMVRGMESRHDAVYLQPMTALAVPPLETSSRHVGNAYQLDASWQVNTNVKIQGELVFQTAGAAVRGIGGHDTTFGMLISQFRF